MPPIATSLNYTSCADFLPSLAHPVLFGIPPTPRAIALIEMRRVRRKGDWVRGEDNASDHAPALIKLDS
jgi:hypothetical protein